MPRRLCTFWWQKVPKTARKSGRRLLCFPLVPDASLPVRKVLESAIANARVKADKAGEPFRENDLVVKETYVDEGVTLKRFRARAQGRAARINKRTSHITVVVANKEGNR